jgi:hypothetical protein
MGTNLYMLKRTGSPLGSRFRLFSVPPQVFLAPSLLVAPPEMVA